MFALSHTNNYRVIHLPQIGKKLALGTILTLIGISILASPLAANDQSSSPVSLRASIAAPTTVQPTTPPLFRNSLSAPMRTSPDLLELPKPRPVLAVAFDPEKFKKTTKEIKRLETKLGKLKKQNQRLQNKSEEITMILGDNAPLAYLPEWAHSNGILSQLLGQQEDILEKFSEAESKLLPAHPHYRQAIQEKNKILASIRHHLKNIQKSTSFKLADVQKQRKSTKKKLGILNKQHQQMAAARKTINSPFAGLMPAPAFAAVNRDMPQDIVQMTAELNKLETRLQNISLRHPQNHPDIIALRNQIETLRQIVASSTKNHIMTLEKQMLSLSSKKYMLQMHASQITKPAVQFRSGR